VQRLADEPAAAPLLSVPNFYGAHGYDPALEHMSAIFYAAGPDIRRRGHLEVVRNIDVAPTVVRILGVAPDATVEGKALDILRAGEDGTAERERDEPDRVRDSWT
jgi:arylsulfatase A-like enzyme